MAECWILIEIDTDLCSVDVLWYNECAAEEKGDPARLSVVILVWRVKQVGGRDWPRETSAFPVGSYPTTKRTEAHLKSSPLGGPPGA